MKSYFKRFIVVCFTLIIIFVNISSFYYVAYADNQSSGGHFGSNTDLTPFNKLYDGFDFSDTIAKHESFYFSDSVGNKHAVARVGSAWICLFGSRATFNGTQDEQLNYYLSYYAYTGYKSIANSFSAFMASKLGSLTKGGYTLVENALSSNISTVANDISYSESDDSISIDSNSIDKLREEIKKYYYDSIGIVQFKCEGTITDLLNSSRFTGLFEYEEDKISAYNAYSKYKFALVDIVSDNSYYQSYNNIFWNDNDYIYMSDDLGYCYSSSDKYYKLCNYTGNSSVNFIDNKKIITRYDVPNNRNNIKGLFAVHDTHYNYICSVFTDEKYNFTYINQTLSAIPIDLTYRMFFYSYNNEPLRFFKSYSSLYNYLHGDQNAYLSSKIEETGKDISMSIKDMDANLGDKMDTLIDTINSKKEGLSADELQNVIDKGLEDLNKNTEDIKDNTSDILDTLKEQNNILLQILGVTEYIAYQNDKYNNTYTKADMSNLFKKSFNRVSDAVLYGEKVDDDNEETIDRTKFSYHNGIFGHFPFSVPYQLYEWLKILQSEPICPEFTYHYGFLIGISKDSDEYDKYKITFNLSAYDSWREVAASFLKLAFTLTMAIGTYKKFKGEL